MACALGIARNAAHAGTWHTILGLEWLPTAAQIGKARRNLQRDAHQDKGGSPEVSQLINRAADELLSRLPEYARHRACQRVLDEEEERAARAAADARREEEERTARAAEDARREVERVRRDAARLLERERARHAALRRQTKRGGSARATVCL